ncbi:unnamed protein product [Porites evermanni]|uniref:DUF4773 domain-containing protein n=1 Tax=Porites evermanni TaxID=104178 RepID=A0ABN8SW57_9CNID|nr:unnamed protein product [Porites evermanni]
MFLPLFVAFCAGLATASRIQEAHSAVPANPTDFVTDDRCSCTKDPVPQCGCCADFKYEEKTHHICVNTSYIASEKALRFTVTYDGKVLLNETLSAKNPPPFCQGLKPLAYICEKYSNMSYGDDNKWGGCLEIYGGVVVQILDIKFGCFYLPVDVLESHIKMITEEPTNPTLVNRFLDFLKKTFKEQVQGWFGWEPTEEKK